MGGNPNHQLGEVKVGYTTNIIGKLTHQRVHVGFSHFAASNFRTKIAVHQGPKGWPIHRRIHVPGDLVFFSPGCFKKELQRNSNSKTRKGSFRGLGRIQQRELLKLYLTSSPDWREEHKDNHGGFRSISFALLHNLGWIHKPYGCFRK